mgnify:CR=1 FL=1|jgi:hypothetical protein
MWKQPPIDDTPFREKPLTSTTIADILKHLQETQRAAVEDADQATVVEKPIN